MDLRGQVGTGEGREGPARPRPPTTEPCLTAPTRPVHLAPLQQGSCYRSHLLALFHRCTNQGHGRASPRWQRCFGPAQSTKQNHSPARVAIPSRRRFGPQNLDCNSQMRTQGSPSGPGTPRPEPWSLSEAPGATLLCHWFGTVISGGKPGRFGVLFNDRAIPSKAFYYYYY